MSTILNDVKKLLGLNESYGAFDKDVIIGINSALMTLNQLGIGPKEGFAITGGEETWDKFIEGATNLEAVKTYVYLKTKMVFDPPGSSFVVDAITRTISELEWRLNAQKENYPQAQE